MRKIRGSDTKKARILACGLAAGLAAAFLCVGCDLFTSKRIFDDAYYDNNFIAAIGFGAVAFSGTTMPDTDVSTGKLIDATGKWDFAYRYQNWDSGGTGKGEYMKLAPMSGIDANYATPGSSGFSGVSGGVPAGLASDALVYRLELVNFLTGGDFEGIGSVPAVWTKDASSGAGASTLALVSGSINGQSLQMTLQGGTQQVTLNLDACLDAGQTLVAGDSYQLAFNWSSPEGNANNAVFKLNGASISPELGAGAGLLKFTAAATNSITITTESTLNLVLDDLTLRPSASDQLRLLLKQAETNPPLESFLYRFTFWVCEDPTADVVASPYRLKSFKTEMHGITKEIGGGSTVVSRISTTATPYPYERSTTPHWQQVTVSTGNGNLQMYGDTTRYPVLELLVDLGDDAPGRILVAQPELRAFPDGY